ncbi:hypothetical protein FPV67DRAFT_1472901 [Lyophyllum atratum]|nr:hypothetical protein FPV67DRAFT_1472901 [Lyophyllum atratum]
MADAVPPTYQYPIPSIHTKYPELPLVLGTIDLNHNIDPGSLISPADLRNAEEAAEALKAAEILHQAPVTPQMVHSASLRVTAIRAAHSAAEYAPANINDALAEILDQLRGLRESQTRLEESNTRLEESNTRLEASNGTIKAILHNTRIIGRNQKTLPEDCSPLQKTVPGDGAGLAQPLGRRRRRGAAALPEFEVGDVPPNFKTRIDEHTGDEILELIVFYNDDFGILPGDGIATRHKKLRSFLSDY